MQEWIFLENSGERSQQLRMTKMSSNRTQSYKHEQEALETPKISFGIYMSLIENCFKFSFFFFKVKTSLLLIFNFFFL